MLTADIGRIPWTAKPARGGWNSVWSRVTGDIAALRVWFRQVSCGFGGHMMVLRFEPRRVSLECVGCGKQTPGWTIDR